MESPAVGSRKIAASQFGAYDAHIKSRDPALQFLPAGKSRMDALWQNLQYGMKHRFAPDLFFKISKRIILELLISIVIPPVFPF